LPLIEKLYCGGWVPEHSQEPPLLAASSLDCSHGWQILVSQPRVLMWQERDAGTRHTDKIGEKGEGMKKKC